MLSIIVFVPWPIDFGFFLQLFLLCSSIGSAASFQYMRIGSQSDLRTKTTFGIAMMGGGSDLDQAFRWLCNKGGGGDFLILRLGAMTTTTLT